MIPEHRKPAFALLRGEGIEIGALHEPMPLPAGAKARYVDAITPEEAARLFPEIDVSRFVALDRVVNLDGEGLGYLPPQSQDFVIASHVLEHLANPLKAIEQIFRILKPGGRAMIAIPDMRLNFDRYRPLTSFEHLWSDYETGVVESSDEHYIDFLRSVAPHVFEEPPENLAHHIERARARREHSHVWDSSSFRACLLRSLAAFGYHVKVLFESPGEHNLSEYFVVLERQE